MNIPQYKPYNREFCRIFEEKLLIEDGWYYLSGSDRKNVYKYSRHNAHCTLAFSMDDNKIKMSYDLYYKNYFNVYEKNKHKPDIETKLSNDGLPHLDYCDPKVLPFWDSLVRGGMSHWYIHTDFPNKIFFGSEHSLPEDATSRNNSYIKKYKDFWPDAPIDIFVKCIDNKRKRDDDDDDVIAIKKCVQLLNNILEKTNV